MLMLWQACIECAAVRLDPMSRATAARPPIPAPELSPTHLKARGRVR